MSNYDHPAYRPHVNNGHPQRDLAHSGSGWCPKCQTSCVLLDDYERYAPDPYDYEAADYLGGEPDDD